MDSTIEQMRREVATAESQLQSLKDRLERKVRECKMSGHNWGPVKYEPIETKGYQTQGDPPGTMGVDWQGPMWIEPTCTKQWSRTCNICGHKETTQSTRKERMPGTIPGTSGEVDVPYFGNGYSSGPSEGPYHWSDKPRSASDRW